MFAIFSFSEKNEAVNAAPANVMSVFITLPAADDPANSNKFLFFCTSQSVYKDSINFLNFSDQKFSLAIVLKLVLNFWANLSLGVLIKFVLIKKGLYR